MIVQNPRPVDPPLKLGVFCILGSSVCFSLMSALVKAASVRLHPAEITFFRSLVTLLLLTPWLLARGVPILGRSHGLLFLRGLLGFCSLTLGVYSTAHLGLADATILWKTSVLFTALFSVVILKEVVTRGLLIYIVSALLGAGLIVKPSLHVVNVPGLAALGAGALVGLITVSIRKLVRTENPLTIVWAFSFYATILPVVLFFDQFQIPTAHELEIVISMGLIGTIGQILVTNAYRFGEAAKLQTFAFSEGIYAALLGWLFWAEVPDALSAAGAVLIVLSGVGILRLKAG